MCVCTHPLDDDVRVLQTLASASLSVLQRLSRARTSGASSWRRVYEESCSVREAWSSFARWWWSTCWLLTKQFASKLQQQRNTPSQSNNQGARHHPRSCTTHMPAPRWSGIRQWRPRLGCITSPTTSSPQTAPTAERGSENKIDQQNLAFCTSPSQRQLFARNGMMEPARRPKGLPPQSHAMAGRDEGNHSERCPGEVLAGAGCCPQMPGLGVGE